MTSKSSFAALGALALTFSTIGAAAEYLSDVTSEVYQTKGTPKEIAQRASVCISQNLKPGTTDSQLIISSDPEGGTVVARSAHSYSEGLLQWQARSTFTFEAREDRFRIVQTNLERFTDRSSGWAPIGKWKFSGWSKAQDVFAASAAVVARCVIDGPKQAVW